MCGVLGESASRFESEDAPVECPECPEPKEEAINPPTLPPPVAPSQEAWDEHFRTGHILYRSECPICVKTRGREAPHNGEQDHKRAGTPTVCLDYKEPHKGQDQRTKTTTAHQAACKGPGDEWLLKRLIREIENMGHVAITLKGDNENAMAELIKKIKEFRPQPTLLEGPPGNDPQSNGVAEKGVQDVMGMIRSFKLSLEYRLKRNVNDRHPIVEWAIEHAAWLITHLRVGRDGRTASERVSGRQCVQPIVEFGEQVWAKPLRISAGKEREKANLQPRWFQATWVGAHDRTNEHVVVKQAGGPAVKVRTVKRMATEDERWNASEIDDISATPRSPDPDPRC